MRHGARIMCGVVRRQSEIDAIAASAEACENLFEPLRTLENMSGSSRTSYNLLEAVRTSEHIVEPFGTFCNLLEPLGTSWIVMEPHKTFWNLLVSPFLYLLVPCGTLLFLVENMETENLVEPHGASCNTMETLWNLMKPRDTSWNLMDHPLEPYKRTSVNILQLQSLVEYF